MSIFDRWFSKVNDSPLAERMNGEEQHLEALMQQAQPESVAKPQASLSDEVISSADRPPIFTKTFGSKPEPRTEQLSALAPIKAEVPASTTGMAVNGSLADLPFTAQELARNEKNELTLKALAKLRIDTSGLTNDQIDELTHAATVMGPEFKARQFEIKGETVELRDYSAQDLVVRVLNRMIAGMKEANKLQE